VHLQITYRKDVVLCTDGSAAAVFDAKRLRYRNAPAADSLNKLSMSGPSKGDERAAASLKKCAPVTGVSAAREAGEERCCCMQLRQRPQDL